jgi:hypothetical protein
VVGIRDPEKNHPGSGSRIFGPKKNTGSWIRIRNTVEKENFSIHSSVADPDHFDADPDPDPTSEKNRIRILFYIKFCNKIFLLKNGL